MAKGLIKIPCPTDPDKRWEHSIAMGGNEKFADRKQRKEPRLNGYCSILDEWQKMSKSSAITDVFPERSAGLAANAKKSMATQENHGFKCKKNVNIAR